MMFYLSDRKLWSDLENNKQNLLTLNFTLLWANPADDKIYYIFLILPLAPHPPNKKKQKKKKQDKTFHVNCP